MAYARHHFIGNFGRQVLCGVIEHSCADAVLPIRAMQHVDIDAALTAAPESLVVGKVGEGDGLVAQLGVHRHNGSTTRQREDLGMRPACASQGERHVFDALRYVVAAKVGMDDEA